MIQFDTLPPLRRPVMIASFEGWNDAGEAASDLIAHLVDVWDARPVAAIDPQDYYDFQVARPRVGVEDGRRQITWPTTRIFVASPAGWSRDVVLVDGLEPSFRWQAFVDELLDLAEQTGTELLVTIGALLGDTPHTRPIAVSAHAEDEMLQHRHQLEPSTYEGPTGIVGVLTMAGMQIGLDSLSLWAAVPHYAAGAPSPKATLALLNRLEDILDLRIDAGELTEDAKAWQRGVDELAASDTEIAEYVHSLEEAQDTTALPEASGEAIAREFERYLRHRDDGPEHPKAP